MASAVFSDNKASPFPSPSSSFIPPPPPPSILPHDPKKRSSAMSAMPGEMTNGHYYNSQRNSAACCCHPGSSHPQQSSPLVLGSALSPPSTSKRQSAPSQTQTQTQIQTQIQAQNQMSMTTVAGNAIPTPPVSGSFSSSSSRSPPPAYYYYDTPATPCSDLAAAAAVSTTPPSPPLFPPPGLTTLATRAAPPSPSSIATTTISRRPSGWSLKLQSCQHQPPSPSPSPSSPTRPVSDVQPVVGCDGGGGGGSGEGSLPTPTSAPLLGPLGLAPAPALAPSTPVPASDETDVKSSNDAPLLRNECGPESLIVIRDYGFSSTDDRFYGRGPLVPKWNRLSRLNRQLGASGSEDGGGRRQKSNKKKKKKKKTVNGWSDSDDTEGDDSDGDSGRSSGDDEDDEERYERDGMPVAEEDAVDDEEEEEEDELRRAAAYGGGGGFGWFGRLSWRAAAGSSGLVKDTDDGVMGEFPSQNDLERNFGVGQEVGYNYDPELLQEGEEGEEEWGPLLPGLYRALYAFDPEGTAEMGLEEDQIVKVVGRGGGEGWAVVMDTREGRSGGHALVPESYLEVVQFDEDDGDD